MKAAKLLIPDKKLKNKDLIRNLTMRKIVLILLVVLVKSAFAIDCDEALANLSGAATDIRANHNGHSSFILEDQGAILEQDNAIMEKYDYENSLNFYRQNCK